MTNGKRVCYTTYNVVYVKQKTIGLLTKNLMSEKANSRKKQQIQLRLG